MGDIALGIYRIAAWLFKYYMRFAIWFSLCVFAFWYYGAFDYTAIWLWTCDSVFYLVYVFVSYVEMIVRV